VALDSPKPDLAALLGGRDEHEPRIVEILSPHEGRTLRATGAKVYRVLTRVSDDKLLSIPQQVRECASYAAGEAVAGARRPDHTTPGVVDRVYNFGEQSGFTLFQSTLFQSLLRDAQADDFDGFIARDSSRLGRDYWDKFATLGLLRRSGKELHILEDGGRFDWEDDTTKVRSWADTWSDSKKKMEEIRKSLRATERLREEGFPTTQAPFGYEAASHPTLRRRIWQPSQDAPTVARLFARADEILARGEPVPLTQLAFEAGISRALAFRILRNEAYTGGFRWGGAFRATSPDIVPALVARDVFERVQTGLRRTRRRGVSSAQGPAKTNNA
jgi:DNA invertase Pin-like site-specific DNA recombinase